MDVAELIAYFAVFEWLIWIAYFLYALAYPWGALAAIGRHGNSGLRSRGA